MPRVTSKPGGGEMMVALDSGYFNAPDGVEYLVTFGMRLRHDHPVVRMAPDKFAPASFDDFQIQAARAEMLEKYGVVGYA